MQALWQGSPASVREVWARCHASTSWAYTTVKTLLGRLVEKGVVKSAKRGNAHVFEPLVTRGSARREAVRSLLQRAIDGTLGSLVQHLMTEERLSARDRRALRELLRANDEGGRKSR